MSLPFFNSSIISGSTAHNLGGCGGGCLPVGGWVEVGRTTLACNTLGSTGYTVTCVPDKRYYMVLSHNTFTAPGGTVHFRLGNGSVCSGTNYSIRYSANGCTDVTGTSQTQNSGVLSGDHDMFKMMYIANRACNEKLMIERSVYQTAAGASQIPGRGEQTWKWVNTCNPLDRIHTRSSSGGCASYEAGSEMVVLGWDPADTHTTNFWEELASVDLSGGAADNLSSGTITAKKYLWVQAYLQDSGGTTRTEVTFNNDICTNYSERFSNNGGADSTDVSRARFLIESTTVAEPTFVNMFIINNSSTEKLVIGDSVREGGAGAANDPDRREIAAKWANTSNQITEIDFDNTGAGSYGTSSILKVWGAN